MPPLKSDYDQAIHYLNGARELMEQLAEVQTRGLRVVLFQAVSRLSSEKNRMRQHAAELQLLRRAAERAMELGQADAGTDILKAVAVLRDTAR